jgi:hypothetical protein
MGQLTNQYGSNLGNLGSTAGSLTNQYGQNLNQSGQIAGTMMASQQGNALSAGTDLASLAQKGQQMNTTDAAALQSIGGQQQQLNQQNLNLAYHDFQNQLNWPKTQLSYMQNLIQGLPNTGFSTSTTANAPLAQGQYNPSPLSTLTQTGALASALGLKRGGRVKKFKRGGRVRAA